MYTSEIDTKLQRLAGYLQLHQLDGVLLSGRPNFSWITGGRDNHIVSVSEGGVAGILATADRLICLANQIESPRFRTEELAHLGIEVIDYPWWDIPAAQKRVREVIAGRRVAADLDFLGLGLPSLPDGFSKLRWSLTEMEIQRYRLGGQLAIAALESVCRQIQIGDTEFDIAARMEYEVQRTGASNFVTLVATDQRVFEFRHPIPTARKIDRYAMLVLCAEYRGLISSCTRFVHFGQLPEELRRKQQLICDVDTTVNLATRVGRKLGEIFADLQGAYAAAGFPDEWQRHHQGGPTGYAGRDIIAHPGCPEQAVSNQAYAWNPSITGVKSEDTVLLGENGLEILTQSSPAWPMLMGHSAMGEMPRPDILVR